MPAIWLTPLLHADRWPGAAAIIDGLRAASAPALVVGGPADDAWNSDLVRSMTHLQVLEIPDTDHVLQVPGDPLRSVEALRSVVVAMREFVGGLTVP